MAAIPLWHVVFLLFILCWVVISSVLQLTQRIRSLVQEPVAWLVHQSTPFILRAQKFRHGVFDAFFSALSCVVSVPFYTAFLPMLFWSGHSKFARQMTLLIAFCDYIGNTVKDVVSAPRPTSPPVRRITATKDEQENAMEYGLPSSHVLNTVCLSGYLLHYLLAYNHESINMAAIVVGVIIVCIIVMLIGLGRIYLGMHSPIDVVIGIIMGLIVLWFWILVNEYVDIFIIWGQNVTSFWAVLSFLLLFAYPRPELPTPSFEYHAAFSGVAFGIVSGIHHTYLQFHHEGVPRIFSDQLTFAVFFGRALVGIPTILTVKFCSKALAIWTLPVACNALGIPVRSSCYIPALKAPVTGEKKCENRPLCHLQNIMSQESYNVDTGIRFLQYAGLAWSVVDLVPSLFAYLGL